MPRVTHQVKYLGLVENIKVRQAGFAFRAEYHRVVERWRLLSPVTWPGPHRCSDKKACLAILKQCAAMKPKLRSDKTWAQPGKSKLFIKAPKTLATIDKLRQVRIDHFVRRIQQLWSKYKNKRVAIKLRMGIAALYESRGKQRNRASISRPFGGEYFYSPEERRVVVEVLNRYGALGRRYGTFAWPHVAKNPSAAAQTAAAAGFAEDEERPTEVMEEERILFADHCARLVTAPKSAAALAAHKAAQSTRAASAVSRGGGARRGARGAVAQRVRVCFSYCFTCCANPAHNLTRSNILHCKSNKLAFQDCPDVGGQRRARQWRRDGGAHRHYHYAQHMDARARDRSRGDDAATAPRRRRHTRGGHG